MEFVNKVYNQETKERFLNSIDLDQYPPRWWERVFEKTYIFEKEKRKDLYDFTVPDILEFYKFLDIGTFSPLMIYNINLLKYGQWALNESLICDGQNHFDEITNEVLSTCVSKVKIEQSILSYDRFIDLIRRRIVNDQDKYIFFCLFEGIKGKNYQEIVDLKMEDIDENELMVTLSSGRKVYVPEEFIDICKKADAQTEYYNLPDLEIVRPLIPSNTILKEKSNSRGIDINRTVHNTISRNINYIDDLTDVVTAKSIRDSGMIHYLKRRADKLDITVVELLYDIRNCRDIIDKYQFNIATKKRWILQFKDYLQ